MIGRTISHYLILEQIGAGGMGVVYRAHDERLDRDVALKVLSPALADDKDFLARFRREARTLSKLNHPNIATVHDFDTDDGTSFLVMEFIQGTSLASKIRSGPLPEKEVARLGLQLLNGLCAAHAEGIIHRDEVCLRGVLVPHGMILTESTMKIVATQPDPVPEDIFQIPSDWKVKKDSRPL
jgi:serine/threonine protein kinase